MLLLLLATFMPCYTAIIINIIVTLSLIHDLVYIDVHIYVLIRSSSTTTTSLNITTSNTVPASLTIKLY